MTIVKSNANFNAFENKYRDMFIYLYHYQHNNNNIKHSRYFNSIYKYVCDLREHMLEFNASINTNNIQNKIKHGTYIYKSINESIETIYKWIETINNNIKIIEDMNNVDNFDNNNKYNMIDLEEIALLLEYKDLNLLNITLKYLMEYNNILCKIM